MNENVITSYNDLFTRPFFAVCFNLNTAREPLLGFQQHIIIFKSVL